MLEIGEDVWGLNEFFNNDIDELVNAFTSAQKEVAPDIEFKGSKFGFIKTLSYQLFRRLFIAFLGK